MDMSVNNEHWNQLGGRYSVDWASPSQQDLSRKETDFVVRHIPEPSGNRVLDIGIGNGRILESLLLQPNVSEVYGVDIAPSMLELCHDRLGSNPKIKALTPCDIASESLPVDGALQFISAVRVLKYVPNWWDVVQRKLIPQLVPGGVLVFSMPNRRSVKRFSRPYAVQYETTTEVELRHRLKESGVHIIEIAGFSRFPEPLRRRCSSGWSRKLLIAAENMLEGLFGKTKFATELFVAVRRS